MQTEMLFGLWSETSSSERSDVTSRTTRGPARKTWASLFQPVLHGSEIPAQFRHAPECHYRSRPSVRSFSSHGAARLPSSEVHLDILLDGWVQIPGGGP